ncbi:hypothetical protein D9615_009238 [Tricholomella constricta]|uniref:guanosine-diphosphatase n=1 Tax=Tricholomella constricta TaxID=117010 RepID=A0A8H5GWK0_9AGAR|nr:hypothetical protein D9615_009238 [Tricholomella constricta]
MVAPSYAAIIDAGSTSSRLFIYQWQDDLAEGEPLALRVVFPRTTAEKTASVSAGGIQHHEDDMAAYLNTSLQAGSAFLQARGLTDVPLYLLATGGMRTDAVPGPQRLRILEAAHTAMRTVEARFSVGTRATNAQVISGRTEGLYAWVALNYGRGVEEQVGGVLELGGASMQIAYKVPAAQVTRERVCLLSGAHRVYSETWDEFGGGSINVKMQELLLAAAGGADGVGVVNNPCLPRGQVSGALPGSARVSEGTGDFATCLRLAKGLLVEGLRTRNPIPSYLDIASFSKLFFGISNFKHSYDFFSKWGAYDALRAYDREAFTGAVTKYCSSDWAKIPWVAGDNDRTNAFAANRCINAAWMLMLLHDERHGLGLEMTQYDTWKGLLRFPTTPNLASRSSWTMGAAALVARHGELRLCPAAYQDVDEQAQLLPIIATNVTTAHTIPTLSRTPLPVELPAKLPAANFFTPPATVIAYVLVAIFFAVIGYQRRRLSRLSRVSSRVEDPQENEKAPAMRVLVLSFCHDSFDLDPLTPFYSLPSWLVSFSAQSHNVVDMVDSSFGASRGDLLAIWARDKMDLDVRSYHKKVSTIKNLEKVWSEISSPERHSLYTTLLLDDSPAKAILQPYNHLIVEEYNEDLHAHNASLRSENPYPDNTATSGKDTSHSPAKYDDTLLAVVGILDAMKDKPNVARWIRRGGLCLQDRISDAESGEQPWFRIPDVRKHWKTRGAVALDDLGVNLDPGVPS